MNKQLLTSQASDEQKKGAIKQFEGVLKSYDTHIDSLLKSKRMDPQEFKVSVVNAIKKNPALLECEVSSLFGSILTAAELGLMPNTPFQLSYIVPYFNNDIKMKQAQFQIGYLGWIELAGRNESIAQMSSELVYANDDFEDVKGSDPVLLHKPAKNDRGERIGAYAIAWLTNGHKIWCYLPKEDILKIKKLSKGSDSKHSAWNEDNDPNGWMWKKCAIKQLAKMLPKTREIQLGIYAQDAEELNKSIKVTDDGTLNIDDLQDKDEQRRQNVADLDKMVTEHAAGLFGNDKKD